MNKDTVVASTIGFSLGVIVAIIIWLGPQFLSSRNLKAPDLNRNNGEKEKTLLTINTPTDGSLETKNTVTVEGKGDPSQLIIITSPIDETGTYSTDDGSFGVSIDLEEGENEIVATQYAPNGEVEDSKIVTIVYTSEQL